MQTKYFALLIFVIAMFPSAAYANAGTPLMWASVIHLVFGNAFIGLIEGILLSWIFKRPKWKSILILIAANYASAWAGSYLTFISLNPLADITIENLRLWFLVFVIIAFLITLLIESPFFWFALGSQKRTIQRVAKATLLIHGISYTVLLGWYWMPSGTTMMTQLEVVPASDLLPTEPYALFYISPEGNQVLQSNLLGSKRMILCDVPSHHKNDRLFVRKNMTDCCDLLIHLETDEMGGDREELIAPGFSKLAPIERRSAEGNLEKPEGTSFNFGPVPSLASKSDWEFRTGFWPIEGIRGENEKEGAEFHFSLEIPFVAWEVRNAIHIEGDRIVFQLGDNQICILAPESRRIALITRGKGPIVAKPML